MTVQTIANGLLYGISSDTKPTTVATNTLFFEQDTYFIYRYTGSAWTLFREQGYLYTYFIYKIGSTYYAQSGNGASPATRTSNSDFKTLIQAIISGISPAGTPTLIQLGAGDFNLASQFSIPSSAVGNITIQGMGQGLTNIVITSAWNGGTPGTAAIKIGVLPTITSGITGTLTANCTIRSNTCTVSTTDAAKFAVGDYVILTSTLAWSTAPSAGSPQAETKKITAINTGTGVITFDVPTFDTYNTANTAVIYRLSNMISNIRWADITVKKGSGLSTDTGNTTGVTYFTASCVDNLQLDNPQFIDPVTNFDACCNLKTCVNSSVDNISLIMTPGNTYNEQYGLAIGTGSTNVTVSEGKAFGRFRHAFEGANDSASSGWQGIAREITFSDCEVEGGEVGSFDTHVGGELISFVNCKVNGTTVSTGNVGFEIRARKTQLIGCSVEGSTTYGFQFSGDAHDGVVSGCTARGCLDDGLRLINDQSGVKRTTIIGSTFNDNANNGIRLDLGCDYTKIIGCNTNANLNNGMYLKDSDYLTVTNNVVTNNTNKGIWYDPATLTLSNSNIAHNVLNGNGSAIVTTSSSTGTFGTGNLIKNNIGSTTNLDPAQKTGTSTQSGNGTTKVFNIAHGLATTPTYANAIATSSDANGQPVITKDGTNIIVTYNMAPLTGTNNLTWLWVAIL
jgi:parallel beta-helix repeat protein